MRITKYAANPILHCCDVVPSRESFEVIGVFNAGAVRYKEKYLLLVRVAEKPVSTDESRVGVPIFDGDTKTISIKQLSRGDSDLDFSDPRVIHVKNSSNYLTSISHIRLAESEDGVNFTVSDKPLIEAFDKYTAFGVEDVRITEIGGVYYLNFSAASDLGIITRLFSTEDFSAFKDMGNIFHPDNKDVTIFPEKIGGLYYALHRPSTSEYGRPNIWIASSPDLIHWGNHKMVADVRPGQWDSGRVGASCIPFRTEKGWLEIYHGATKENRYCLGAMILDLNEPWKVIARSELPILEPSEKYELEGFFGNVVFSCGLIKDREKLNIYYGAADDSVCLATTTVQEILETLGLAQA